MTETFTIKLGNTAHLSDPCYTTDDDYNNGAGIHLHESCVGGDWQITLQKNERGEHAVLRGQSPDASRSCTVNTFAWVDSGQFGIFDNTIWDDVKEYDNPDNFYGKAGSLSLSEEGCGVIDNAGFVTRTAYGDGTYNLVKYLNAEGELTAFEIVFAEEDEDEEFYDWDGDCLYSED